MVWGVSLALGMILFQFLETKFGLRQKIFTRFGIEKPLFQLLISLPAFALLAVVVLFILHAMPDDIVYGRMAADITTGFVTGAAVGLFALKRR